MYLSTLRKQLSATLERLPVMSLDNYLLHWSDCQWWAWGAPETLLSFLNCRYKPYRTINKNKSIWLEFRTSWVQIQAGLEHSCGFDFSISHIWRSLPPHRGNTEQITCTWRSLYTVMCLYWARDHIHIENIRELQTWLQHSNFWGCLTPLLLPLTVMGASSSKHQKILLEYFHLSCPHVLKIQTPLNLRPIFWEWVSCTGFTGL